MISGALCFENLILLCKDMKISCRMKIPIYNAHEYEKTIESMKMIYMLPAPVKFLKIQTCSCTKFELIIKKNR